MDNQVFEEAPALAGDAARNIEKQARQLAYDTRYFVKKQIGGKPVNAATMERLLMARLSKSTAVPAVKMRAKEMLVGKLNKKSSVAEEYKVEELVSTTVANSLYKVFVEGVDKQPEISLDYLKELFDDDKAKYKVRVTDLNNGTSYIRYANREKISELRQKGLRVEKTEHGDPREDEAKRGSQTAAALGGGSKPNDGNLANNYPPYDKVTRGDVIAGATGKDQMGGKKKIKEQFLDEVSSEETGKKITGKGVDNSSLITVFPQDNSDMNNVGNTQKSSTLTSGYSLNGSFIAEKQSSNSLSLFRQFVTEKSESQQQQKLFGLALSVKRGETPRSEVSAEVLKIVDTMSEKKIRDFAKTKHEGLPKKVEEAKEAESEKGEEYGCDTDDRAKYAEMEVIKNRLRLKYGMKNPIVMTAGYEPDGEVLDERRREDKGKPRRPRDRAMEMVKKMPQFSGVMTRSGRTIGQHQNERGVPESQRPKKPEQTTADRLADKRAAIAGRAAAAEREEREEQRRRRLN